MTTFSRLVQDDNVTSVNCRPFLLLNFIFIGENCGKTSNEAAKINKEETKGTAQPTEDR